MSGGEGGTGGEKSFAPSPRRLEEARKKGDVPRSADAAAAAAWGGFLAALAAVAPAVLGETGADLAFFIGRFDALEGHLAQERGGALPGLLAAPLLLLAPLVLLPAATALLAWLAQRAFVVAGDRLLPKRDRIDPLAGAKRRFGLSGLMDFLKGLAKMLLVAAALWFHLRAELPRIVGSLAAPPAQLPAMMLDLVTGLLAVITVIAILLGLADLLWQRFDHERRLRMSFQELREEAREMEGDPHQKAERRRRAEAIARTQMLAQVPKADVVIVNPTHYAVALAWSRKAGSAPECVAKGVDELARAIRVRAMEAGVPIRSDPPTARALHDLVEIGSEVPPDLWRAVAAAIRFAEEMRRRARASWSGGLPGAAPPGAAE